VNVFVFDSEGVSRNKNGFVRLFALFASNVLYTSWFATEDTLSFLRGFVR
jgi:hypothetical protein